MMLDKLMKNPQFLPEVFETLRDGLMVVDNEGNIVLFNRAAEEITGYRKEDVIGGKTSILHCEVEPKKTGGETDTQLKEFGVAYNMECRIRSGDGRWVHLLKNVVTLRDEDGEIIGTVESMTDITSLYKKEMELQGLKQELRQEYWFMGLLGKSVPMQRLYEHIRNAAMSEAPVLIYGESGAGKNLVARALHKLSRRKDGPFMQMNCAALNEQLLESELFGHKKGAFTGAVSDRTGRFEAAHDGSVFLDEIGDMPMSMQVKLLRVLEEKVVERVGDHKPIPVNIRLISATNKDLTSLIQSGTFREDLLYRINSITIKVPSLRERSEDIPLIAFHYLKKISSINNKEITSISPPAMEILINFPWPGNVRRLINALEHSVVTCKTDTIQVSDLPDYLVYEKKADGGETRIDPEKIRATLALYKGNKTLAAKNLGISRVTLWKKLKTLGMEQ
ncbi:MAG TPA: sigma 54-interacting transcriptional regulator [Thermodesulfovibrionales bacterium]|nr:sigma 54-interacting transcriptional regulator [Thermodesulfovibrionales bacterium]